MKTYHGVTIERHGPNTMGLRWIAKNPRHDGPLHLRTDTLAEMRYMIRLALNIPHPDND